MKRQFDPNQSFQLDAGAHPQGVRSTRDFFNNPQRFMDAVVAILKHNGQTLYLVRETKATWDFWKLQTSEIDKVRCRQKHFEALGVSFDVVVTADEV